MACKYAISLLLFLVAARGTLPAHSGRGIDMRDGVARGEVGSKSASNRSIPFSLDSAFDPPFARVCAIHMCVCSLHIQALCNPVSSKYGGVRAPVPGMHPSSLARRKPMQVTLTSHRAGRVGKAAAAAAAAAGIMSLRGGSRAR